MCVEGWCGVCERVVWCVWKDGVVCVKGWCGVCGRVVWCVWKSGVVCVEEWCCVCERVSRFSMCAQRNVAR